MPGRRRYGLAGSVRDMKTGPPPGRGSSLLVRKGTERQCLATGGRGDERRNPPPAAGAHPPVSMTAARGMTTPAPTRAQPNAPLWPVGLRFAPNRWEICSSTNPALSATT